MKTPEDEEFERIEREQAMYEVQRLGQEIEQNHMAYVPMTDYERLEKKLTEALFEVESIKGRIDLVEKETGERERIAVLETIEALYDSEAPNYMFQDGYNLALDHIEEFVKGRSKRSQT
jgi:hypothetical protein